MVHNGGSVLRSSVCERFFDPLLTVLKRFVEMAQENVGARVSVTLSLSTVVH
jgi:hypothetical protein